MLSVHKQCHLEALCKHANIGFDGKVNLHSEQGKRTLFKEEVLSIGNQF